MASGGLVNLIERLNYNQWSTMVDCGFGGFLAIRTKLIPKALAPWLLEKYDS